MPRPCAHVEAMPNCPVCRLWFTQPEYFCLWEGLPQPQVPDGIQVVRRGGRRMDWADEAAVKRIAAENGRDAPQWAAGPGYVEMLKNVTVAAAQHAVNGLKNVAPEEKARRLSICAGCDQFEPNAKKCLKCGCNLEAKAAWDAGRCPINKW